MIKHHDFHLKPSRILLKSVSKISFFFQNITLKYQFFFKISYEKHHVFSKTSRWKHHVFFQNITPKTSRFPKTSRQKHHDFLNCSFLFWKLKKLLKNMNSTFCNPNDLKNVLVLYVKMAQKWWIHVLHTKKIQKRLISFFESQKWLWS